MEVLKSQAVALLIALDYHTANTWDNERIVKQLSKFRTIVEESETTDNEELDALLRELVAHEGEITLIDDVCSDDPADNDENAPTEPDVDKPKKQPKAPRERKPRALKERGRFGAKLGSQAAVINDAIQGPCTVADIVKATNLPTARVSGHLKHLVKLGILDKAGDTYSIVSVAAPSDEPATSDNSQD